MTPILNQVKSGSRHKSELPGRLAPPSVFGVGTNHSLRRLPTEAGPGEGTRVPRRPVLLKLQSAAVQQSGLVCGMAIDPNDYYVITSRRGEHPDRWSWEIRRKSKPLGIKMTGDGYQSDTAAQFAGSQALADFLSELSKEEKRPRK